MQSLKEEIQTAPHRSEISTTQPRGPVTPQQVSSTHNTLFHHCHRQLLLRKALTLARQAPGTQVQVLPLQRVEVEGVEAEQVGATVGATAVDMAQRTRLVSEEAQC